MLDQIIQKEAQTMMNRTMQLNHSAALSLSSFAFYAVRFFSALRFYFYYFFIELVPPERKLVS